MATDPSFHEVLFPIDISYSSSGGPAFNTTIITLTSGFEQRNINWSEAKAAYEVTYGIKTRDQMEALQDFFYARNGKAYAFRYQDWADYQFDNSIVYAFDGTATTAASGQMIKRYEPATSYFYDRAIYKPNPETFTGTWNIVQPDGTTTPIPIGNDILVDPTTGIMTFANISVLVTPKSGNAYFTNVPPAGSVLTLEYGEFHVPVRFDTDTMKITQDDWETMSWPSIELVEVKLDPSNV